MKRDQRTPLPGRVPSNKNPARAVFVQLQVVDVQFTGCRHHLGSIQGVYTYIDVRSIWAPYAVSCI